MLKSFLFTLLLTLSLNVFAQKVSVKKGIIHLGKVEMYRIIELNKHQKAILAIEQNDTLAWINSMKLVNTRASFETEHKVLDYMEVDLVGYDLKVNYISIEKDDLYEDLILSRALSNQSVLLEGCEEFRETNYPLELEVELFTQAIEQREQLLDDSNYLKYATNNTIRSPNIELIISNDIVLSKNDIGLSVSLGRIEVYSGDGTFFGYNVYRTTDQKLVATIEFDKFSKKLDIKTMLDNQTISPILKRTKSEDLLILALQYLADAGYF